MESLDHTTIQDGESRKSQIIKNVLMNWVAFAATILAGFLLSPFLVHRLGVGVYGVWVIIGSLIGYLGLLDFGLTPSMVKYVAEYRARGDQPAMNRLVTCGFVTYSVMGVVSLVGSLLVAFFFNDIFHSPLSDNTAAAVVVLAGVNLALSFPAMAFVSVLRGYQRYDVDATVTALAIVVRSALLVALILRGHGIITLAALTLIFDALRLAYLVRWSFKLNPQLAITRANFDWREITLLFKYSVFVFLIIIGKQMIFYTDSIVIGLFLSTAPVTAYFIASRLVTYLQLLVSEMVGVLTPAASDLHARNDSRGIFEMLVISTKYLLLIALPVVAVFLIQGEAFIGLWMGPGFPESPVVLSILTVAMLVHLLEMPSSTVLLGLGRHRIVAYFVIAQAVTNLALSLLLVRRYGLVGVAMATAIPVVGFTLVGIWVYFRRYLHAPLGGYLKRSVPMPLVVQVPFVASLIVLKHYFPPSSLLIFFLQLGLILVPYGLLAFATCLSADERRNFFRAAERFGLRLSPRFS